MEYFFELFKTLFEGRSWYLAALLLFGIIKTDLALCKKQLPAYLKTTGITVSCGIFLVGAACLCRDLITFEHIIYLAGAITIVASLFTAFLIFLRFQIALRYIRYLSDETTMHADLIKAWEKLAKIPAHVLTPKQSAAYLHTKLNLLIMLGNLSLAEHLSQPLQEKEPARYHLIRYLIAHTRGDMKAAAEEIQHAHNACTSRTSRHLRLQIAINLGVRYHCEGDYVNAADALERAKQFLSSGRRKNASSISALYQNLLFNCLQIPGTTPAMCGELLREYRSQIHKRNLCEYVMYRNVELEYLRNTDAPRETLDAHTKETFETVLARKLPPKTRYAFEISYARSVWTGAFSPEFCLAAIQKDYRDYDRLDPNERYRVFKELNLFFRGLFGPIVERYQDLKEYAFWYMQNQAETDLENYRRKLPEEAVSARAYYLKEKAGLQKEQVSGKYDYEKVAAYFHDALSLYENNGMVFEEIQLKLDLIDEMLALENLGGDLRPVHIGEIRQLIDEIEAALPVLERLPSVDIIYLRMSFYCLAADAYEKCKAFYLKFGTLGISLKQLAPWLHRYCLICGIAVRCICFCNAIRQIRQGKVLDAIEPELADWFRDYPHEDGYAETLLLGRFLGFDQQVPCKRKLWMEEAAADAVRVHYWLAFLAVGWEIDITYNCFEYDDHADQIFFNAGTHPMEQMRSNHILRSVNRTGMLVAGAELMMLDKSELPMKQQLFLDKLYRLIDSRIDPQCPDPDLIRELWIDVMEPVCAPVSDRDCQETQ